MPQLTFGGDRELHTLRITIRSDELTDRTHVQLEALSRTGQQLASAGVSCQSPEEAERLPELLRAAGLGYLYRGAREAVTEPCTAFRAHRSEAKRAWRNPVSPAGAGGS